ncbi:hypothetical protein K435DRAFT_869839 [Dendrothele bispora CBS 962.96]|uniref:Uncharacterized protein n=1 Tax=Dendrothele bispora (strain CBS 962.96) TaxID=1314807 RepID=A0A4S8L850_DENBC|nr:hypothetical protein K435DRAFT_869839 [Dendrothele bispora CBS 962.96]
MEIVEACLVVWERVEGLNRALADRNIRIEDGNNQNDGDDNVNEGNGDRNGEENVENDEEGEGRDGDGDGDKDEDEEEVAGEIWDGGKSEDKDAGADENGYWDTSKALVRRTQCIHIGRMHQSQGRKQDKYEAFTGFLVKSRPSTHTSTQWVAPLIAATSFIRYWKKLQIILCVNCYSFQTRQSRSSEQARSGPGGPSSALRTLFPAIPGGAGKDMTRDMDNVDRIRAGPAQGGKRPEDRSPQELHAVLAGVECQKKVKKSITA